MAALGFAQTSNLFESQGRLSARGIMNNLAGEGISDDIALFTSNLQTIIELDYGAKQFTASKDAYASSSEVLYSEGDNASQFHYIVIPQNQFGVIPFSNGTVVFTLNNSGDSSDVSYHYVGQSDARSRFQLYEYDISTNQKTVSVLQDVPALGKYRITDLGSVTQANWNTLAGTSGVAYSIGSEFIAQDVGSSVGNSNTAKVETVRPWSFFTSLLTKKFLRRDPVRFENISNFSATRPVLNDGSSFMSILYNTANSDNEEDSDDFDRSQQSGLLKFQSVSGTDNLYFQTIDIFSYKEARNIVSYKPNSFNQTMNINGAVNITNDQNLVLGVSATEQTLPGLYIIAPNPDGTISSKRAFSDITNPWVISSSETLNSATNQPVIKTVEPNQSARVLNLIFNTGKDAHLITTNPSGIRTVANSVNSGNAVVNDNWTHKVKVDINGEPFYLLLTNTDAIFDS